MIFVHQFMLENNRKTKVEYFEKMLGCIFYINKAF